MGKVTTNYGRLGKYHGKPAKRKGTKPPKPTSLDAEVPRDLTDHEVDERSRRLARKVVELNGLERRKRNATKAINAEIKECRAEVDKLSEEVVHGEEMVKQGDLFAPKRTVNGNGEALPKDKAAVALSTIAEKAGDAPTEDEDEPEDDGVEVGS